MVTGHPRTDRLSAYGWTQRGDGTWLLSSRARQQWREHQAAGGGWRQFSVMNRSHREHPERFSTHESPELALTTPVVIYLPAVILCPVCGDANELAIPT